jgi:protein disulfide-isomerase A1
MAPVAMEKPQQLRRLLPLIALALVLPGCLASGGGEPAIFQIPRDGSVVELDEGNFEAAVAAVDYLFVDFHAPWCGHCKRLAPQVPDPPPNATPTAETNTTAVR